MTYHSPGTLVEEFSPSFIRTSLASVGPLLPPTYAACAVGPRLLDRLDRWGRRVERLLPFPHLADHYLAEFTRTGARAS